MRLLYLASASSKAYRFRDEGSGVVFLRCVLRSLCCKWIGCSCLQWPAPFPRLCPFIARTPIVFSQRMDGDEPLQKDGRSHGRLAVHDERTFVGFRCKGGITKCCQWYVPLLVSSCSFHPLECILVRILLRRLRYFGLLVSSSLVEWCLHCLFMGLALASYALCTCPCGGHGVHCQSPGSCPHTTSGSFVSSSPLGRPRVVVGGVQHGACKPWRRTTRVRDGRGNVRKNEREGPRDT